MTPHTSITVFTGLPCPVSGIWESMGNFRTTMPLLKGDIMPEYCGLKTYWKLLIPG